MPTDVYWQHALINTAESTCSSPAKSKAATIHAWISVGAPYWSVGFYKACFILNLRWISLFSYTGTPTGQFYFTHHLQLENFCSWESTLYWQEWDSSGKHK
jgi:hypothetical protein